MKRFLILMLAVFSLLYSSSELGIILGEPTGLNYRKWVSASNAIDISVGWSFNTKNNDHFDIHGGYLFHQRSDIRIDGQRMPFYFGPGGRIKFGEDEIILGFRVPLGLYYKFRNVPFSMFFELAPGMNITPSTDFDITGGLGFRYVFPTGAPEQPTAKEQIQEKRKRY